MKAIITCVCVCVALFIVYGFGNKSTSQQQVPWLGRLVTLKIRADVAAKLAKRYNMRVIGIGGGLAGGVNRLGLSFQIRGPLSKEQLRAIIVDCVEEYLLPINTNERLRPSLKIYPFTADQIEIEIFVVDQSGGTYLILKQKQQRNFKEQWNISLSIKMQNLVINQARKRIMKKP